MTDNLLRIATTIVSALIVVLGVQTLLGEPVTQWGGTSMMVALILLTITTAVTWRLHSSFFSLMAFLYSAVLVGRLFGTLRLENTGTTGAALDPLLIGETGPGVPSVIYLSYVLLLLICSQLLRLAYRWTNHPESGRPMLTVNDWAMTFIRLYVGLMFIAHYTGHVLAGPGPFQIFADYFAGVGFHIGAPMVILAGVIEIAVSIGLVFGLMTRVASVVGVLYLFFATLWGDHFTAGYIWVLPNGGWEFSALWIAVILAFVFAGGGKLSADRVIQQIAPQRLGRLFR